MSKPTGSISNKDFSEKIFDLLMGNTEDAEVSVFKDAFYIEWNGDDASIDFYPNIDNPHNVKPYHRLFCTSENPVTLWVYWCSNYGDPQEWIKAIWQGGAEYEHFLSKFLHLRKLYSGDEAMNRFFRELSSYNQKKLFDYVLKNYKY